MRPSDYRHEYAAYEAELARTRYDFYAGRAQAFELVPLGERYADLWRRARLDELAAARDETPAQFETERTALGRLLNVARLGYAAVATHEVVDELTRCEQATQISWEGVRSSAAVVPERLAHEADAARRRELSARLLDARRACDDLRAAQLEALNQTARALGFASYFALLDEATGSDAQRLGAAANALLARTGDLYRAHLRTWLDEHLPPQAGRAPAAADALFFARSHELDQFFPASELLNVYAAQMNALGINVERQSNLRSERAPAKGAPESRCFALDPPADVRLLIGARSGGAHSYRVFFYVAACAQQYAWVSRDLAARYPEFVRGPDATTRAAYGYLFRYWLHEPAWLSARCGLKESGAHEVARACALVELHDVRRACAQLLQQRALAAAPDPRAESLAAEYATLLTEATGFSYEPAQHLYESSAPLCAPAESACGGEATLPPASALRARLFACALSEHCRTRYGARWWTVRAAGDELIDLWNTGARYTVEELAALTGAGALEIELLIDSLSAALTND